MYNNSYFDTHANILPDILRALDEQNRKTEELTKQMQRLCDILEEKKEES